MGELTETIAELAELMNQRSNFYALLAQLYGREVTQDMLEHLSGTGQDVQAPEAEMAEGYRLLQDYLSRRGETTVTDLAVDFARLFLGVRFDPAGSPYESVYTSPDRLMMQEARDQVLAMYREEGLDRAEGTHEPEDHLAIELEFMSHLCNRAADALQTGNYARALELVGKQTAFLRQHLLRWVPDFCNDVVRLAQTDFYKGIATFTKGYLALDNDLVDDIAEDIRLLAAS